MMKTGCSHIPGIGLQPVFGRGSLKLSVLLGCRQLFSDQLLIHTACFSFQQSAISLIQRLKQQRGCNTFIVP